EGNKEVKSSTSTFLREEFNDVFFDIEEYENYTKVEVVHPLNLSEKEIYILHNYNFVPNDSLKATHFIQVPVKKIACLSTSHLGYIEALSMQHSVKAALNPEWIYSETLQQSYKKGELASLGGSKIDMENLLNLN